MNPVDSVSSMHEPFIVLCVFCVQCVQCLFHSVYSGSFPFSVFSVFSVQYVQCSIVHYDFATVFGVLTIIQVDATIF